VPSWRKVREDLGQNSMRIWRVSLRHLTHLQVGLHLGRALSLLLLEAAFMPEEQFAKPNTPNSG